MDAEAFKKVFLPYHKKLYRIAYRIVNEAADDVVQEAYIKLWNKRHELPDVKNTEAFAVIILRNTCLDYLRTTKNDYQVNYDTDIPEINSLVKEIEIRDEANNVKKLINDLPEQQRQVLMMKHWDGYSDEEIEKITGLSAINIRVILSRARKTIREKYLKLNITYGY